MIVRYILLLVLFILIARVFWRVVDGVVQGLSGGSGSSTLPKAGVQMVRDPVCGTFVVPGKALSIPGARPPVYFCSTTCLDRYRSRTA